LPSLLVGTSGFPVAQSRYHAALGTVEIDSCFYQPPKAATAERWRASAPKDFLFTVKAWQLITHPSDSPGYKRLSEDLLPAQLRRCGHFQDTPEVKRAWQKTRELALALKARVILFQTPASFHAGADMIRRMYDFFKPLARGEFRFAWEPRGESWKEPLVRTVCDDLGLIHATDPLQKKAAAGPIQYFRMQGGWRDGRYQPDHRYTERELEQLASLCRAKASYVFFGNSSAFEDAQRFKALAGAGVR